MSRMSGTLLSIALLALFPRFCHGETEVKKTGWVQGSVELGKTFRDKKFDPSQAVVYLEGKGINITRKALAADRNGVAKKDRKSPNYVMDQKENKFVPHALPIPVGAEVTFLNSDAVLHNVHSHGRKTAVFNQVQMPRTKSKKRFTRTEVVPITCDIHSDMRAYVLVLKSPHFTMPVQTVGKGQVGYSYSIRNVPEGSYKLTIWHERTRAISQTITIKGGEGTTVDLKLSKSRKKKNRKRSRTGDAK